MSDYKIREESKRQTREFVGRVFFWWLDWIVMVSIPLLVILFVGLFSAGLAEVAAQPFIALFEWNVRLMEGWHI